MSKKLEIYGVWGSQPTRALLWVCLIKKLPFELKRVNPLEGGTKKLDFASKFPLQTIPSIDDDGFTLSESHAIFAYLAVKHGWKDLYPSDLQARAKIDEYLHWHHRNIRNCTLVYFRPHMMAAIRGQPAIISEQDTQSVASALQLVDMWISKGGYVVGNSLTFADFACYCELDQLEEGNFLDLTPYKNIFAWMEKMKSLPFHQESHNDLKKFLQIVKKKAKKLANNCTKQY